MSAETHPRAQIEDTKDGDEALMKYYDTHKTFAGATVYIKSNVNNDPGRGLDQILLSEKFRWSPAHGDAPFVTPFYDDDDTMDGHHAPPIYDNRYDDAVDATAPDVGAAVPPFTFFTSAKYPQAKMGSYDVAMMWQDYMMWEHYIKNATYSGLQVYIEPNASDGVCFRAAGASAHDVDAQDTRIPPTFMSLKEFPRAVITGDKSQDWKLSCHFERESTFAGAPIYIEPGVDLGDEHSATQTQAWISSLEWKGRIGDAKLNRDGSWQ